MKISDLHCHPSFKPYHNQEEHHQYEDIWSGTREVKSYYNKLPGIIQSVISETARDSQSQLNEFLSGDIQAASFVIHPIERGWFIRPGKKGRRMRKALLRMFLRGDRIGYLAASLTGIPFDKAQRYLADGDTRPVNYFDEETMKEYQFIMDQKNNHGSWDFDFEVVSNYDAYQKVKKSGKIAGFLSLEGGHSLTNISNGSMFSKEFEELSAEERKLLDRDLSENIGKVKGKAGGFDKAHTPIYLTLCHMYQNFLAGHARTYGQGKFIIPGMEDLLDQQTGMNKGITDLGWKAIKALLDTANGPRILIDVKHMSALARKQYYQYALDNNVPIIASHIAMSGVDQFPDNPSDSRSDHADHYFSRWSINMSDEDIQKIHQSDGLIGIALHEGRMPGGRAAKAFKQLKKKIGKGSRYDNLLEVAYMKLIMSNIFQAVLAVNEKSIWTRFMLGTDYDGIMNPFDIYPKASYFKKFLSDMTVFLTRIQQDSYSAKDRNELTLQVYQNNKEVSFGPEKVKPLLHGYQPEELAEMIGLTNFEAFIKRNY